MKVGGVFRDAAGEASKDNMKEKQARNFLKLGERLEMTIEGVAFGGSGIGRVRDLVVFIPFAVDGDLLEIEVSMVRRTYALGRICRILKPSPYRTSPRCPHCERCGGCQYQHIVYEHQLEIKKRQVAETFARIGKQPDPPVREVLPSPLPYAYRGKAEFHLQSKPGKIPVIGYKEGADSRIIPVPRCELLDETINDSLSAFRKKMSALYASRRGGWVREKRVIFWSGGIGNTVGDPGLSSGEMGRVIRRVKGKEFRVPARGFFQANTALVGNMVDSVVRACALSGKETVLDLYCGSGLFSLFLAPLGKRLIGVEVDEEAVACAVENLREEGIGNGEFFVGDVAEILRDRFVEKDQGVEVAVLDPPRIGCSPDVLDALLRLRPDRILYISCNPATQARDVQKLRDGGYRLVELLPLDMFPQTKHIEVIGLLERKKES